MTVTAALLNMKHIQSSKAAFVAVTDEGSVMLCDFPESGGDCNSFQAQPKSVQQIQSLYNVCCTSGRGFCFDLGFPEHGSDSSAAKGPRSNVQQILSSSAAFAAICRRWSSFDLALSRVWR